MTDPSVTVGTIGDAPIDPTLVSKLDAYRAAKYDLQRYVETRRDIAALNELAAGTNHKLANYAAKEANEDMPVVEPDRPNRI